MAPGPSVEPKLSPPVSSRGEEPATPAAAPVEVAPPPLQHAGHIAAVEVGAQPDDEGMPLQAIMDEVSAMIQLGRRAAFDMTAFGPTAARAVGLVRAGAADEARHILTTLRKRLYDYLGPKFSARVEELEVKLTRIQTFLRTDQAKVHLDRTREALRTGDFAKAQVELRRLEGEVNRLEESLGTLGATLEQVDLFTAEVERLGGDTTPALLVQGKALDAARGGDRRKAEGLLSTASAMLLDTLAPLLGRELMRYPEKVKALRSEGRDIRAAVGLIRQITIDLKTRNYARALASFQRLREEVARQEEAVARAAESSGASKAAASSDEGPRTRIKGKASAVAVGGGPAEPYASPAPAMPAPSPPPAPAPEARPPVAAPPPAAPPAKAPAAPPPLEVKPGRAYLFYEQRARRAAQAFLKLKGSKKGLFLTTTFPPRITEDSPLGDTEVVWLSESPGWEDSINPRTLEHDVAARIHGFLRDPEAGALALDGLAYLISENGVDKVEKFLKSVLDTAAARNVGLVATLAPGGIEPKAQARLESLFDAAG